MNILTNWMRIILALLILLAAGLACSLEDRTPEPLATARDAAQPGEETAAFQNQFAWQRTAFGFFPSPGEPTVEGMISTIQGAADHGDVLLFQEQVPWSDFQQGAEGESQAADELSEVVNFARLNGLEAIFVVDPLNGLNRREFLGLPESLQGGDFSTPEIRSAYLNFALRLAGEYQPRYLGLASEINTYFDAHPGDQEHFLSLYRETYQAVKQISPHTQVFVTFQWDDLNRLDGDGQPYQIKWEQIEVFEPQLDLWAISSYPFFFFPSPADIPEDYYTPLLERTEKPLALSEGGWSTQPVLDRVTSPQMQVDYLHLLDEQLGDRLVFWINLTYSDLDWPAYQEVFQQQGSENDLMTLSNFIYLGLVEVDGTPKPGLQVWDQLRDNSP